MSYALTDAGEQEMRAEMKVLEKLNEDIDQLSSDARDCGTVAPNVQRALDLAWYLSEEAMRDAGTSSCGHVLALSDLIRTSIKRNYCACCDHYREVGLRTQMIRRQL